MHSLQIIYLSIYFLQLGTSDDNLQDRADQDKLMGWNQRKLNTQLLKLGKDTFHVKELLNQCLQPSPKQRPTMKDILTHSFFSPTGESGEYWQKLDGSIAVPMTKGQTSIVGCLGIVVFLCTLMHVFFCMETTVLHHSVTQTNEADALTIDFTTHQNFNDSVMAWKNAAVATIGVVHQWKNIKDMASKTAHEMDDSMQYNAMHAGRNDTTEGSLMLNVAYCTWFVAALFMAYSRLAMQRWPLLIDEVSIQSDAGAM